MDRILALSEHLKWSDFFDIAIVWVIIYQVLLMLRGTRAVQMMLGLVIIVTLYGLSVSYEFYALHWTLSHVFDYFFLIVIILFQDQIRRTLASVGQNRIWEQLSPQKKSTTEADLEEIIEATMVLGKEKIGALIVIERSYGLTNFIQTGTPLDADVHSDLLYTLFQIKSPLHDGAVIVSSEKIKAAGCFLPLSNQVEIDRHYGTRHRAAIGISEVSDAVVIIVSEETGKIGVCFNGVLYLINNEAHLRFQLKELLSKKSLGKILEKSNEESLKGSFE